MSFTTTKGVVIRRRRRPTSTQAIRRVQRDVRQLKANLDLKFIDTQFTDDVVSATGLVQTQQFIIPDGNSQSEKEGLKIVIKSIQYRFQLKLPSTTVVADATDVLRAILVRDKQANGALPTVADILNGTDIMNHKNLENSNRFVTLFDKTISISSMGGFGDGTTNATLPNTKSWSYFKKMNLPIQYNNSATTGVITTINSNNLVLMFISEFGKCGMNVNVRIRYTD